ncbi:Spy/CpxP family protein refolding chaperone [Enterovirga rhinocerotis]|uniref:LTXXQ motif family protein n=1 Tax=Enterovirga rhinocerotis TaxID=1339210 RepID=A0A4R7C9I0_9HYPH|nr:Spy/CpxP family protein refolding chaperone [Enterovirga rhinocerotis]TDR94953.1 LTXXQ motif family protein [Enterovirga rhinocerotis]
MTTIKVLAAAFALMTFGSATAQAQTAPAQTAPAQPGAAPQMIELHTAEDADAVLAARLSALKTVIGLNADQDKLWTPVETAIRQVAKNAAARRADRAKAAQPQDFVDILVRVADAEAARAADLKTVATALKPLVTSLTDAQRRRIPAFLGLREGSYGRPQPTAELWLFEEE